MWYVLVYLIGLFAGAVGIYLAFHAKRRKLDKQAMQQAEQANRNLETARRNLNEQERLQSELANRNNEDRKAITKKRENLESQMADLKRVRTDFDAKCVSYEELTGENAILKRDIRNIHVQTRKLQLDRDQQQRTQELIDQRTEELGSLYLKDNVKWSRSSLTPNNFANSKTRLQKVIESCRQIGLQIGSKQEADLLGDLKAEYEKVVRAAFEREEQMRITAQIREEAKQERENKRELKQLERERAAIQAALEKALAEAKDEHSAEIENLRARLTEAKAKSERAISRAQLTKSGHVYVISNIGSFGEGVVKIGVTRRLEPLIRVKELGDASVPFPFDVHMMISSDDAPTLERALHREFRKHRVNKTNPRKEFFRVDVDAVHRLVEESHGEVEYTADAEALEYRQSLAMPDEDEAFIEGVYAKFEDEEDENDGGDGE